MITDKELLIIGLYRQGYTIQYLLNYFALSTEQLKRILESYDIDISNVKFPKRTKYA
jgi:hypothetical protein